MSMLAPHSTQLYVFGVVGQFVVPVWFEFVGDPVVTPSTEIKLQVVMGLSLHPLFNLMFGVFFESGVIMSEVSCFSCFKNTSGGLSTPLGPCCVLLGESGVLLSPSNSYNATGSSFPSSWIFLYRGSRDSASATEMMLS